MHLARFVIVGLSGLLLAACVPSPTATPPLATRFPTLAVPTDTPQPESTEPPPTLTTTPLAVASPLPAASPTVTRSPVPATPVPATTPVAVTEAMPPLLHVAPTVSDQPVSVNQPVALGVYAADDVGLARIELYDESELQQAVAAPSPAPRTLSLVLTWKSDRLGSHHLRVIAYDTAGKASRPAVLQYQVINDNHHPSALLIQPLGEVRVPVGAPVIVQGAATDEVAVTRVELFVDDSLYTYLAPDAEQSGSPVPVAFMWVPTVPGVHRLFLRAYDNLGQTGDTGALLVNATGAQAPAVSASYERDQVEANGTLLVHSFALSPAGIARVELWSDNQMSAVFVPADAGLQTTLDAWLVWQAPAAGDHLLSVRAYDRSGLTGMTEPQTVHVLPPSTAAATATPLPPAATVVATPLPATPTPQVIKPAPPTIALTATQDPLAVQLPGPLHFRLAARATSELDYVELWAFYQGETTPQLVFTDNVKGATEKTLEYDWRPARAGVAFLFARVFDQLGQEGKSPVTTVYLNSPPAPTPTPAFLALAPRWQGNIPTNKFALTLVQSGSALRGSFLNTPLEGAPQTGTISAGSVSRDRLNWHVVFDSPDATPRSLDFQCAVGPNGLELTCNYQDEAGNRGSVILTPAP